MSMQLWGETLSDQSDNSNIETDLVGVADEDTKPLIPPAAFSGRRIMRRILESALETIPVAGSALTALYQETHPPLADRIRQSWEESITRRVNRISSTLQAHQLVMFDLQGYVYSTIYPEQVSQAGQLSFFRDGMLRELRQIADGRGNSETVQALAAGLSDTDGEVTIIVASLTAARDIMRTQPQNLAFAHRLDEVLYGPVGKMGIRHDILEIINGDPTSKSTQANAARLCDAISQFNAGIVALATPQLFRR